MRKGRKKTGKKWRKIRRKRRKEKAMMTIVIVYGKMLISLVTSFLLLVFPIVQITKTTQIKNTNSETQIIS